MSAPERTFARGLTSHYGTVLPDDPRSWTDEELGVAWYDETLRHPSVRFIARAKRRGVVVTPQDASAAVMALDVSDPAEDRMRRMMFECLRCASRGFCGRDACIPF